MRPITASLPPDSISNIRTDSKNQERDANIINHHIFQITSNSQSKILRAAHKKRRHNSIMEHGRNNDDEEHHRAFGEHLGIPQRCRHTINRIKNNDPTFTRLYLYSSDAKHFADLALELLGRYIADNNHLDVIFPMDLHLTDEKVTLLFKYLKRARSLTTLDLAANEFGLNGIQSMVPVLKNSLTKLNIGGNDNINTKCFRLVVEALYGGSIEDLNLSDCKIDDIMALEHYTLPNLQLLNVNNNSIHIILSLEKSTNLERLWLEGNTIGKEG